MMFSYLLTLAYDGTSYFGWQKTKTGPSIQESLEKAIAQVAQEPVLPEAASRTDRGVHAEGQRVAFSLAKDWDPKELLRALNGVLPKDIRIVQTERALAEFHPTLDAKQKEYHYRLCLGPVQDPHHRHFSWHFRFPLDLNKMYQAIPSLIGKRDFSAFANEVEENPICTLSSIDLISLEQNRLQITLKGDRFLYKMARNLAGTFVYVGCGKISPISLPSIVEERDRKRAGVTAPAHGLFLHRVDY